MRCKGEFVKSYCTVKEESRNCTSIKSTYGSSSPVLLVSSCLKLYALLANCTVLYCTYVQPIFDAQRIQGIPDSQQTTHTPNAEYPLCATHAITRGPARVFALLLLLSVCIHCPMSTTLYPVHFLLARAKKKTMRLSVLLNLNSS